jgi:hypothetical protein
VLGTQSYSLFVSLPSVDCSFLHAMPPCAACATVYIYAASHCTNSLDPVPAGGSRISQDWPQEAPMLPGVRTGNPPKQAAVFVQ